MTNRNLSKPLALACWLLSLGGLSAACFWWHWPSDGLTTTTENRAAPVRFPHNYLVDPQVTQFNPQGRINYQLQATTIEYFQSQMPTQPEVVAKRPQLTFFDTETTTPAWAVSAQRAQGSEADDELVLEGDVYLQQLLPHGAQIEIATAKLWIQPNRRYAQTHEPVTITDPHGQIQAVGLQFSLDAQRIELLSEVHGVYRPP